jgi:diaminohydroxyphosphoribosylaminopyrimidine deaminase/5-amino-6-(5-phosphoribosylamino)uracil reductase
MNHADFMRRAVRLAFRGTGKVSPNPRVGCVVVKDGHVLAEGFHARYGGPHAEQVALGNLDFDRSSGCTLYVTLEPCDHQGKTPPCTEAILRAGIQNVVIGYPDPNPIVDGRGIRRLLDAGLNVQTGVLEEECRKLNEAYFKFIRFQKPFITLKIAQTLDGKIATTQGDSKWISNEQSRSFVRKLRKEYDAVLVGVQTVIQDDPELTVRNKAGKRDRRSSPRRIVLDSRLRIPKNSRILKLEDPDFTIAATTRKSAHSQRKFLENLGVRVWVLDHERSGKVSIPSLLKKMADEKIASVLVEGGADVFTSFLHAGEVDRIIVFTAPTFFGQGVLPFRDLGVRFAEEAIGFKHFIWKRLGSDMMFCGEKPCLPASLKK